MAEQIIKQPNGLYCIYSSTEENITYYNLTAKDIVKIKVKAYKKTLTKKINELVDKLDNGERPYYHQTMGVDAMITTINETHGLVEAKTVLKLITKNKNQ